MPLTSLLTASIRGLRDADPGSETAFPSDRFLRQADQAARTGAPVLIDGEPGCGAEAFARAIHACGDRSAGPFVRWRADAPDAAGAATLARLLAEAAGGTLLIRSAHALGSEEQSGLLRLLQDRDAGDAPGRGRTGRGPGRIIARARIIAAAHGHLIDRVRAGTFREDLFYRLNIVSVHLPRLRARRDLVLPAAGFLAARFAADEGKRITGLSPEAEALLTGYEWPGNLRQLENAVLRAVLLANGPRLTPTEFPQIAARMPGYRVEIPPAPVARALEPARSTTPAHDTRAVRLIDDAGGLRSLGDLEADIIRFALDHCGGHISAVSRHLGIGRSTLYRKLKDLGLADGLSNAAA